MSTSIPSRAASRDEQLVDDARGRLALAPAARDRVVSLLVGGAFLVAAAALAAATAAFDGAAPWTVALLVAAYAVASRVEFEVGGGAAVPTQLVFVPMLFVLPPGLVPLAVAAGFLAGALPEYARGATHPERALVLLVSSWHAFGPALVLLAAEAGAPRASDWPIYVCALAAQHVFDLVATVTRECLVFGVRPRELVGALAYTYSVDALLAPVGLLAASASAEDPYAWLLVLPVVALLSVLARERRARIDRAIEADRAYRAAVTVARRDALTGLGNRLAWEETLAAVEARGSHARPLSVLLIDLDGLKQANDTSGHAAGDAMLVALGDLLRQHVRECDTVARTGGDEFAVLMQRTSEVQAADALGRLVAAIEAHPPVLGLRLSASVGSGSSPPEASAADAERAADRRMYEAKRSSRRLEARNGEGRRSAGDSAFGLHSSSLS